MNSPANPDQQTTVASTSRDDSGFFQPYSEFAKNLRTWFIAYGIGAPALLVANKDLWEATKLSGHAKTIAILFLAGVCAQVIPAMIYKQAMWHLYAAELDSSHKNSSWYKWAEWISDASWPEAVFDIITLGLFTAATVLLLSTLS